MAGTSSVASSSLEQSTSDSRGHHVPAPSAGTLDGQLYQLPPSTHCRVALMSCGDDAARHVPRLYHRTRRCEQASKNASAPAREKVTQGLRKCHLREGRVVPGTPREATTQKTGVRPTQKLAGTSPQTEQATVPTNFDASVTGWRSWYLLNGKENEAEVSLQSSPTSCHRAFSGGTFHISAFFSASYSLSLTLSRAVAHHACSAAQHVTCDTRVRVLRRLRTQNVG